ncbi:MAG: alpha-1,4-glucan--maltose-1-phosphate maltosyltransferase [Saprospiraceae bacterium]|nr:alpha-1,4-glucan--maltose-1-phosphate maltosyltransferase [Saprospiraceae bacterium]
MRNRVFIERVQPELDNGRYFIKRVLGEKVHVSADVFSDGHDAIRASLMYKHEDDKEWTEVFMQDHINDYYTAHFRVEKRGFYHYKIEAWVDRLLNWYKGFKKKHAAGQDMAIELKIGVGLLQETAKDYKDANKIKTFLGVVEMLEKEGAQGAASQFVLTDEFEQMIIDFPMKRFLTTYDNELKVRVGRHKELFSTWYELFPRSTASEPGKHGTFKDVEKLLPRVAEMGFDVLYLPPIHPIGKVNRKGKNNAVTAQEGEPGSPWAIGSDEGGHKAIHSELGTMKDYKKLIKEANKLGIEIALDLAFQCAPDHPYIKEHPEWFIWRPDGTIMYAENPPKKYQDIVPLNFESDDWEALWEELKSVILFWVKAGVTIFRVDNPHTKPFRFWEWAIAETHKVNPDVIFLSEAFSRPKIMAGLAKAGFQQSYSYFTWRNTKSEMEEYLTELSKTTSREYFRPNFWPNTPDILPYELMGAGENQFIKRLLLAATLSSNYGMYGPAYEYMENTGNTNGKEEYFNSEKYETRYYDWDQRNKITDVMTKINQIRKDNAALQSTWNVNFTRTDNEQIISYIKTTEGLNNIIWCIINFDPNETQYGNVEVPRWVLDLEGREINLRMTDLLTGDVYYWKKDVNFVKLDPNVMPGHVFKVEVLTKNIAQG